MLAEGAGSPVSVEPHGLCMVGLSCRELRARKVTLPRDRMMERLDQRSEACECRSDTNRQEIRPHARTSQSAIGVDVLVCRIVCGRRMDAAVMPLSSGLDVESDTDSTVVDLSLERTVSDSAWRSWLLERGARDDMGVANSRQRLVIVGRTP